VTYSHQTFGKRGHYLPTAGSVTFIQLFGGSEVLRAAGVSYQNRDDDFREELPKANEVICQEGLCNGRSGRECR
jgi:hypothetical protein